MGFTTEKPPELKPGESSPIYMGGHILQFQRLYRQVLATETVIVNPNPESPIFAIIVLHSKIKKDVYLVMRKDSELGKIPGLTINEVTKICGSWNEGLQPIDTYKWLANGLTTGRFVRNGGEAQQKVPEWSGLAFHNTAQDGPFIINKNDLDVILKKICATGLSGKTKLDEKICRMVNLVIQNKALSAPMEILDTNLGTDLDKFPERKSRAGAFLV